MSSYDPVEGVDYIFDRYAYLGIVESATQQEIEQTVKAKRAEVHPDRLNKVHENVRAEADRIRLLIDQCAEILLNDDLRPLYTQRLRDFREKSPKLVSKDGRRILDMTSEKIDLGHLLTEQNVAPDDLKKEIEALTGYSPKQLVALQKLYKLDPTDFDNRTALEDALGKKLSYFTAMEEMAWAQAGIINYKPRKTDLIADTDGYSEKVEENISARRKEIRGQMGLRNDAIRIGIAKPPLLLADESNQQFTGKELSVEIVEQLVTQAQSNFDKRAEAIREIVEQKKQTLQDIMDILVIEDLGIPVDIEQPYGLHLVSIEDGGTLDNAKIIYSLQITKDRSIVPFLDGIPTNGLDISALKEIGMQGCTILHTPLFGQDIVLHFGQAAAVYFSRYIAPTRPNTAHQESGPSEENTYIPQ